MDAPQILNFGVPLLYLEPGIANQVEASRCLCVFVLGAYIWDWLASLSEEYRLLKSSAPRLPLFIYFLSRVSGLIYIIISFLFQVLQVSDCEAFHTANTIFYGFSVSSSSYLFLLRVWAVFHHLKWVQAIFCFLWIGLVCSTIAVPFAVTGARILPTNFCIDTRVKSFASAASIASTVYDTLVFLAVSFAVFSNDNPTPKDKPPIVRLFCNGEGLSSLSRAVFQGGQFYFLTTVGINMLTTILLFVPSAPPIYRAMFTIPNNALQSAMACRVYRQLILGIIGRTGMPARTDASTTVGYLTTHITIDTLDKVI